MQPRVVLRELYPAGRPPSPRGRPCAAGSCPVAGRDVVGAPRGASWRASRRAGRRPSGRRRLRAGPLTRGCGPPAGAPRWPPSRSWSRAASRCWRSAPTPSRRRAAGRHGGGPAALRGARPADRLRALRRPPGSTRRSAPADVPAGPGLVLADWAALARRPEAPRRFHHVVLDRPAARAGRAARARGPGGAGRAGRPPPRPGSSTWPGAAASWSWPSAASASSGSCAARSPRSGGCFQARRRGEGEGLRELLAGPGRHSAHARGGRPLRARAQRARPVRMAARIAPPARLGVLSSKEDRAGAVARLRRLCRPAPGGHSDSCERAQRSGQQGRAA